MRHRQGAPLIPANRCICPGRKANKPGSRTVQPITFKRQIFTHGKAGKTGIWFAAAVNIRINAERLKEIRVDK